VEVESSRLEKHPAVYLNLARYVKFKTLGLHGTQKAEVLNSLIINTTAKANDTTDILQTFR